MAHPIDRLELAIPVVECSWTTRRGWLGLPVPTRSRTTSYVSVVLKTSPTEAQAFEPYQFPAMKHWRRRAIDAAIASELLRLRLLTGPRAPWFVGSFFLTVDRSLLHLLVRNPMCSAPDLVLGRTLSANLVARLRAPSENLMRRLAEAPSVLAIEAGPGDRRRSDFCPAWEKLQSAPGTSQDMLARLLRA